MFRMHRGTKERRDPAGFWEIEHFFYFFESFSQELSGFSQTCADGLKLIWQFAVNKGKFNMKSEVLCIFLERNSSRERKLVLCRSPSLRCWLGAADNTVALEMTRVCAGCSQGWRWAKLCFRFWLSGSVRVKTRRRRSSMVCCGQTQQRPCTMKTKLNAKQL